MPSVSEAVASQTGLLEAVLKNGTALLSANQEITFTQYTKLVLPLDGYVYWVRSDLLSSNASGSALFDDGLLNQPLFNQNPGLAAASSQVTVTVSGSLHYSVDQVQRSDETFSLNKVIFTANSPVTDFNQISATKIYIGVYRGIRFAFSKQGLYYEQANLYHYLGDAIYPSFASQIIDSVNDIPTQLVVSNSLPAWLSMNQANAQIFPYPKKPSFPLYPSFLVAENLEPPYGSVHIPPELTQAIQAVPRLTKETSSHYQLVKDTVEITLYGLTNNQALDFQDYVYNFIEMTEAFGLLNPLPVIRDEKRVQTELNLLAMKKSIKFEVSYYQVRMNTIARQLILSAIPTFVFT